MISTLLWQCPLCHSDDALRHKRHWFQPDEVLCTSCGTVWEMQRVVGDDYRLRVVRGAGAWIGCQRPLADWYDTMKAGIKLVAQEATPLTLEPREELYVQSRQAILMAEKDSPLFGHWEDEEAPRRKEGDLGLAFMKTWDTGRLLLTSQRLIWRGKRGQLSFWLRRLNSVHTEVTWFLGLLYGLRLYKLRYREESILKWLTYTALAAKRMEQVDQQHISFSNY